MENKLCDTSPCPEGMECVADQTEASYSCVCPQGKTGQCTGKFLSSCLRFIFTVSPSPPVPVVPLLLAHMTHSLLTPSCFSRGVQMGRR